ALTADGVFAAQTESPFLNKEFIRKVYACISGIFPITGLYLASIPTYPSGLWSFTIGSKSCQVNRPNRRESAAGIETKYYTPSLHESSFVLPKFVEELITRK